MPGWRNRYFVRLALSYSALAVLLIGTAGGYLYNRANAVMVEEISKDSQHTLLNIQGYLENTLLQKYEDTFISQVMATVIPDSTDDLMILLDEPPVSHMYQITTFVNDLNVIASANEGLAGITIYFAKSDYVIDEKHYYRTPANSADRAFIDRLPDTAPNRWIVRKKGEIGVDVLTYVYTLPYMINQKSAKGYLYIDISLDYVKTILNQMTNASKETLVTLDRTGAVMFQSRPVEDRVMRLASEKVVRDGAEIEVTKDNASDNIMAYLPPSLSANGWGYVVVKPTNSFFLTTEKFKNDIIWSCAIILLAGILTAVVVSKRFYVPFGRMARSQSLLHLVNGNLGAMDNPDGLPVYPRYVAVLVKNVGSAIASFQTLFSERRPAIPHDLVLVGEREAVVLFYPEAAETAPALSVREEMRRLLPFYTGEGKLVVGIGGEALLPESVHESRTNAEYACQYGFETGYPAIILYDEVMHRRAVHLSFPYEPFCNAVLAGNSLLAERMIGCYVAELAGGGMSIESLEVNLMQAVTSMSGFMIDHDLQHLVPGAKWFADARKTTLEETGNWLTEMARQMATHYAQRASNGHLPLVRELKAYMNEHLDEDISLDSLAERANLTPNYVSMLFKEATNVHVGEYLTRIRLEKAANLLRDTKATVSEISLQVGYRYSQYFSRKFKAKYGVTPLQYRQASTGEREPAPEATEVL